jgi:hypothetical protein
LKGSGPTISTKGETSFWDHNMRGKPSLLLMIIIMMMTMDHDPNDDDDDDDDDDGS